MKDNGAFFIYACMVLNAINTLIFYVFWNSVVKVWGRCMEDSCGILIDLLIGTCAKETFSL